MSELVLRLRKGVNPILVNRLLHPLQHPKLIPPTRRMKLYNLLSFLIVLLIDIKVQLADIALNYVHLSGLEDEPSLVETVVRFPY